MHRVHIAHLLAQLYALFTGRPEYAMLKLPAPLDRVCEPPPPAHPFDNSAANQGLSSHGAFFHVPSVLRRAGNAEKIHVGIRGRTWCPALWEASAEEHYGGRCLFSLNEYLRIPTCSRSKVSCDVLAAVPSCAGGR